jgi:hypothetical protein
MRFIDTWLPLIVIVREGRLDRSELDQMVAGFESHFERGESYAVLSVALWDAGPPDALARMRIAEWLNQPKVRRFSKDLCAGSATVTARAWERHAMTALSWLWVPVAPHRAVASVVEGIGYCADRLVERKAWLPASRERLQCDVYRALTAMPVVGLGEELPTSETIPPGPRNSARGAGLETLTDAGGRLVIGWVAESVLWASFHGRLSAELASSYAAKLEQLLSHTTRVRYFIDSSSLDSVDLAGRNAALRALIAHQQHLVSVVILSWAGGVSSTARALLQPVGSLLQVTTDRLGFEARLHQAAPQAREAIEGRHATAAPPPGATSNRTEP